ncbi:MAG: MFS transporter [Bacteroidota bacterium]
MRPADLRPETTTPVLARLSTMLFLQFFVWGSWYATTGNYMAAMGWTAHVHWAYTVGPLAGLLTPFFLGFVADRFFAAERVLGVLGVLGAVPMFASAFVDSPTLFVVLLLAHTLCFFPTLGVASSVALHHITERERHFPRVRLFGTLGWIAAGGVVSGWLAADATALPLQIAALGSLAFGLYAFTLPHTPPPAAGQQVTVRQVLGLDALKTLGSVPFYTFLICDVIVAIPYALYYAYVPLYMTALDVAAPAFKLTFGQWTEVAVMLILPWAFARLGIKWMVVIGMGSWMIRYGLFFAAADAVSPSTFIMAGILLHGLSFTFVYIAAQIYIDRRATPDIRSQAQGLLVMVRSGIGMLMGAQVAGLIFNTFVGSYAPTADWRVLWAIPIVIVFFMTLAMAILFYDDSQ